MTAGENKAITFALQFRKVQTRAVGRVTPTFTKLLCKMPRSRSPYTLRDRTVLALSQGFWSPENRALLEEFLAQVSL